MPTANGSAIGAPLSPQTSYSASKSAMAAIFGPGHRYNTKDDAKALSGDEPPSGIQGQGTKDEPYDQGNAPKAVAAAPDQSQEPLNGVQGKGTKTEPHDQGNASESTANSQPITTTTQPPPEAETAPAQTNGTAKDTSSQSNNERGRTLAPPSSTQWQDRSVSPGTLDDGSHQLCGGERGGGYTPSSGLGRLAGKVFGSKN